MIAVTQKQFLAVLDKLRNTDNELAGVVHKVIGVDLDELSQNFYIHLHAELRQDDSGRWFAKDDVSIDDWKLFGEEQDDQEEDFEPEGFEEEIIDEEEDDYSEESYA